MGGRPAYAPFVQFAGMKNTEPGPLECRNSFRRISLPWRFGALRSNRRSTLIGVTHCIVSLAVDPRIVPVSL